MYYNVPPQGTVLSPLLFTIYPSDFSYNSGTCHLQKFSHDSSIVGCINKGDKEGYRGVVGRFVRWSEENHLKLSVSKTKELVVDFQRSRTPPTPINIQGEHVETEDSSKYLEVHINSKPDWSDDTETLYRKRQSRLSFLRQIRSFSVCSRSLKSYHLTMVTITLFFAVVCWGGGVKAGSSASSIGL